MDDDKGTIRRHKIEMQKKFTLSFACLIFFFIGAPLGSIIRKGGLAVPVVVSVLLFIIYYILDNSGYKLARDGRWEVWQGMWLSSAVLLVLGVFFTYKAVNDSAVFNADAYRNIFRKLIGKHQIRFVEIKEVVMDDVHIPVALDKLNALKLSAQDFIGRYNKKCSYRQYWEEGYDRKLINELSAQLEETVEYMSNSKSRLIINKLMDFPVLRSLFFYHPTNYKARICRYGTVPDRGAGLFDGSETTGYIEKRA